MEKLTICKEGNQSITSVYGQRVRPKWKVTFFKKFASQFKELWAKLDLKQRQSQEQFHQAVEKLIPGTKFEDIFQFHSGIDIVNHSENKDLIAPFDGVITEVFENDISGKYLKIKCLIGGVDFIFSLCHCKEINVKISDKVKKGDKVGVMGETGTTVVGVHCHITVRRKTTVVNPLNYFTV